LKESFISTPIKSLQSKPFFFRKFLLHTDFTKQDLIPNFFEKYSTHLQNFCISSVVHFEDPSFFGSMIELKFLLKNKNFVNKRLYKAELRIYVNLSI
tara:strand:- start:1332 stop:1622 length:291 start_codon:yes stop_codon:yes gene_type:complete